MPKVTALITVFNEETWISHAINSLLNQSLNDIEVLVINDGSTDKTPEILASFEDSRLRVLHKDRMGRAAALEYGVSVAQGEYIAILDADDEAYRDRLLVQANFLDSATDVAWVGCGEERRDSQRSEAAIRRYPTGDSEIRKMATRCIPYSHSGVMFRSSLKSEGLNYDPSVPYLIDFEFFLRVASVHQVANLEQVLVMRRLRDESFFQSKFKRKAQNRALSKLSSVAISRFNLPFWFYFFPLARLGYDWVPNNFKRIVRRLSGLRESFGPQK